jgi:hypothetical protein
VSVFSSFWLNYDFGRKTAVPVDLHKRLRRRIKLWRSHKKKESWLFFISSEEKVVCQKMVAQIKSKT